MIEYQEKTPVDIVLQNKWVFYIAIFVFVMISGAAILRIITPPQEIPETDFASRNFDQTQSNFSNITYVGVEKNFPPKLKLAQIQNQTTSAQEFITNLTNKLNLTKPDITENLWTNSTHSLSMQENGKYILVKNGNPFTEKRGMTTTDAVTAANNFIKETFPNANMTALEDEIIFQEGFFSSEDTSANNAHSAKVPFSYSIGGYPVFYQYDYDFPLNVTVFNDGEIQKVDFFPGFIGLENGQTFTRIEIDQALKNINENNLGSVISAFTGGKSYQLDISNIQSGEMTDVSLEYRLDPDLSQAVPYYRFSGEVKDANQNTAVVEIITPAIKVSNNLK